MTRSPTRLDVTRFEDRRVPATLELVANDVLKFVAGSGIANRLVITKVFVLEGEETHAPTWVIYKHTIPEPWADRKLALTDESVHLFLVQVPKTP